MTQLWCGWRRAAVATRQAPWRLKVGRAAHRLLRACCDSERLTKLSEAVLARRCVAGSTSSTTRHSNDARRVLLGDLPGVCKS